MDSIFLPEGQSERIVPRSDSGPRRIGLRGFVAGLVTGIVLGALMAFGWMLVRGEAASSKPEARDAGSVAENAGRVVEEPDMVDELDDSHLRARWDALRLAFLEAAAPVSAAIDRAERLRKELPALQVRATEAAAAFLAAKQARELAESDLARLKDPGAQGTPDGQGNRGGGPGVELMSSQSQVRLDGLRRDRQRLIDSLIASGNTKVGAESAAFAFFNSRITAEETRLQRMKLVVDRGRSQQDLDARFGQAKRLAVQQAEIEARLAEELSRQSAWEKVKAEKNEMADQVAGSGLSIDDRQQLDSLLEVVRGSGSRPPEEDDPIEFRAFLDRFESRLKEARSATARSPAGNVAGRYSAIVNRLLRARDGTIEP